MAGIKIDNKICNDYLGINVTTRSGNEYRIWIDVEDDSDTEEIRVYANIFDEPIATVELK